jgi:hypothetical protein
MPRVRRNRAENLTQFNRTDRPRRAVVPDHDHQAEFPPHPPSSVGVEFKASEGGKMGAAVSMARWINTLGGAAKRGRGPGS